MSRHTVNLPEELIRWALERKLMELRVELSDIAIAITLRIEEPSPDHPQELAHLLETVREASRIARTGWPLLLLLELSSPDEHLQRTLRDPIWHKGGVGVYLLPGESGKTLDQALEMLLAPHVVEPLPPISRIGARELVESLPANTPTELRARLGRLDPAEIDRQDHALSEAVDQWYRQERGRP